MRRNLLVLTGFFLFTFLTGNSQNQTNKSIDKKINENSKLRVEQSLDFLLVSNDNECYDISENKEVVKQQICELNDEVTDFYTMYFRIMYNKDMNTDLYWMYYDNHTRDC